MNMPPQPTPLAGLVTPESPPSPLLSSNEVYRILIVRFLRGRIIFGSFAMLCLVGSVFAWLSKTPAWAVTGYIMSVVCLTALYHMRRKLQLVRRICDEPSLVYWAQPTAWHLALVGEQTFLTFHCRTGASLEVCMSREQLHSVAAWLRHHNRDIRFGGYDDLVSR